MEETETCTPAERHLLDCLWRSGVEVMYNNNHDLLYLRIEGPATPELASLVKRNRANG